METLETLNNHEANYGYKTKYSITKEDVDNVNFVINLLETGRNKAVPRIGDIIQLSAPDDGKIRYMNGHLDTHIDPEDWRGGSICVKPYTSFVFHNGHEITSFSTSGGYWVRQLEKEMYEFIEEGTPKMFCKWGHCGVGHSGAIYFVAKVNTWRLIMESIY